MLEQVEYREPVEKKEWKQERAELEARLAQLQQEVKEKKLPVIILFEGWGASGKGSMISQLIANWDPRGFRVFSTVRPDESEQRMPPFWRHWIRIPARGEIAVMDRCWYQEASVDCIEDCVGLEEGQRRMDDINTMERQLTDDGYLIIKFFLHISQKEQKERFCQLEDDKSTSWRVTERDRKRNREYDLYYRMFDRMLEYTNTVYAPWHAVGTHDKNGALRRIYQTVIQSVEAALEGKTAYRGSMLPAMEEFALEPVPRLSQISLDCKLEENYKKQLRTSQEKLSELHGRLYREKRPVVVVYEGWDASGKGGNIKRVAAALDPRGYEAIPIAAPTREELDHHYLWRFWKRLPKTGHIAIFDRSWYGRVMVERIEGFCTQEEWQRAYREINEFEKLLCDWGAVVVKFWLQIDQEEQLRRFTDRQNNPEKQWKITEEDWRNREKWDQYEVAVDEMLQKTSTQFAPWHIIESQDKKYARIKALNVLISAIEEKI